MNARDFNGDIRGNSWPSEEVDSRSTSDRTDRPTRPTVIMSDSISNGELQMLRVVEGRGSTGTDMHGDQADVH